MEKNCLTCRWARLPVNKEIRSTHVGCIFHSFLDDELLIKSLESQSYTFPENNIVRQGWIYNNLKPDVNRSDYDYVDAGVISNFCLITPKNGYCNAYNISRHQFENF